MREDALADQIRQLGDSVGFDVMGFAEASEFQGYPLNRSKRRDPRLSLPDARTIVVAGIYIGGLVLPGWDQPPIGRTSRLFLSGFFNDIVKPLGPLAALIRREGYTALVCDDFKSDGSIVPLKLAAIRAGLGWQGKNSLLVTKKYGTLLALGGILTNAKLPSGVKPEADHCKGCQNCRQACPMQALDQPYVLNKRRCLSYLLQSNDLPQDARAVMENRVMDCEICQQACPWNAKHIAQPLATPLLASFQASVPQWLEFFALDRLAQLTAPEYRATVGRLKIGIPFSIFHRNVMLASERLQPH